VSGPTTEPGPPSTVVLPVGTSTIDGGPEPVVTRGQGRRQTGTDHTHDLGGGQCIGLQRLRRGPYFTGRDRHGLVVQFRAREHMARLQITHALGLPPQPHHANTEPYGLPSPPRPQQLTHPR
jgi:hypothetical protein